MRISTALFFAACLNAAAQAPEVPHRMKFADLTLTIRDDARGEIQKDVNALTQSPKHFAIKVDRARTYFPIIEKVFREEGIPDDFKYLVLQESALIADAVSVSNAVGFWQFKDFTAIENGLRVDREIDERLNIVSSSRAAARYLKKNNVFFNNWLYALQAYQMGAGGAMKAIKNPKSGASHMEIDSDTYWYVKKFIAHKIAFESAVGGKGPIEVITFANSNGRSLSDLARQLEVDESELLAYNKWTKSGRVPADRTYEVVIPVKSGAQPYVGPVASIKSASPSPSANPIEAVRKRINGIQAIQAGQGEVAAALAVRAGVDPGKFVRWNDLSSSRQQLEAGHFYFLAKKRGRAGENFHKLRPGEDLWEISQQYGVKLSKLRKYNRLRAGETAAPGAMLYLASRKPKEASPAAVIDTDVAAVDGSETFNWSSGAADPQQENILLPGDSVNVTNQPSAKGLDSLKILQESTLTVTAPTDTTVYVSALLIPENKRHLVQAGETLYAIGKMYNITVMDLVQWNGLDLQAGIKPGQLLKLSDSQTISADAKTSPGQAESPQTAQEVTHEVKASDTLYSIARQYGVTIKEVMDWNEKKDFSLAVGEKLRIQKRQ